jgi:CRISPR-associated protein Csm3
MSIHEEYIFKGDAFVNRYRIEGDLIAMSPTHIGTGETRKDESLTSSGGGKQEETPEISEIARDFSGRPYLPGSALRGVIRHYLLQVFRSLKNKIADDPNFEKRIEEYDTQQKQVDYMKTKASLLERLFGTPFSESKIEFWDAPVINTVEAKDLETRGWDNKRQSYIVHSVAIDPLTGTAEKHKLYSFEVAPPGLRYQINIVGQNLTETELGFLIFGLYGFNSLVFPLTIGAMSGRGFGRMKFQFNKIYCLQSDELENWAKNALAQDHAGYGTLPLAKNRDELINVFKNSFLEKIKRST